MKLRRSPWLLERHVSKGHGRQPTHPKLTNFAPTALQANMLATIRAKKAHAKQLELDRLAEVERQRKLGEEAAAAEAARLAAKEALRLAKENAKALKIAEKERLKQEKAAAKEAAKKLKEAFKMHKDRAHAQQAKVRAH